MSKFKVVFAYGEDIEVEGDFVSYQYEAGFIAVQRRVKAKGIRFVDKGIWPFRREVQVPHEYDGFETVGLFPQGVVKYVLEVD